MPASSRVPTASQSSRIERDPRWLSDSALLYLSQQKLGRPFSRQSQVVHSRALKLHRAIRNAPYTGRSAQRFDEAPKLDSRLGSGTVAVIAIPLAFRRAAACTVHSKSLAHPLRELAMLVQQYFPNTENAMREPSKSRKLIPG
jgi:hypothetical protein